MAEPLPKIEPLEKFGIIGNQANTNLALNTNFRFVLKKIPYCTYFCTSITSPSSNADPLIYDYITAAPLKLPGGRTNTDVSIRFIISDDFKNYMEMVRWFRSSTAYKNFEGIKPEDLVGPSDAQMLLLDNKKKPIYMINYRNMIPTTLSGFSLSSSESEPSVLTATVQFVYDTYTVTKL